MERKWKPWEFDECESCGDGCVEVLTDLDEGEVWDGDEVRCTECGATGSICTDAETDAHVIWSDKEPPHAP